MKTELTLDIIDNCMPQVRAFEKGPMPKEFHLNPETWKKAKDAMRDLLNRGGGDAYSVSEDTMWGIPVIERQTLPDDIMVIVLNNGHYIETGV